ncbi:hypothetical protein BKA60DRAFT_159163 [Fusarium oxysporum]|nr:hypothetical protein BKA60DRAFT_159163 [Fusarium oxysporum]
MTHATEDVTTSSSLSSTRLPSRRPLPQSCSPITAPETGFTAAPAVPFLATIVEPNNLVSAHLNTRSLLSPKPSHFESLPAAHLRHQPEALPPQFYPRVPGSSALACFIQALGAQGIHDNPEFVERSSAVYDQVFRHSFSPTCPCSALAEANDSEHAQTLQEVTQHLQNPLPPLSAVFGDSVSYNTNEYLQQWRNFLSDQPTQPLSFRKSQAPLLRSGVPISRHWDIDSIWLGATGLQTIRPPTVFRLSFLPSPNLNLSTEQVIRPHGLQLARTRHILLGTFNVRCVRFSAFLFFPHAAPILSTSTIKNALSLERQKDLYDQIIIPAACETIPGPALQEMPQTFEIAYAKSRSFQENQFHASKTLDCFSSPTISKMPSVAKLSKKP